MGYWKPIEPIHGGHGAGRISCNPPNLQIYTTAVGGHFPLGDGIDVEIAEIINGTVTLALTRFETPPQLVHTSGAGYYRFRPGNQHALVASTRIGRPLKIESQFDVIVLHVDRSGVTIGTARIA